MGMQYLIFVFAPVRLYALVPESEILGRVRHQRVFFRVSSAAD